MQYLYNLQGGEFSLQIADIEKETKQQAILRQEEIEQAALKRLEERRPTPNAPHMPPKPTNLKLVCN